MYSWILTLMLALQGSNATTRSSGQEKKDGEREQPVVQQDTDVGG